MTSGDRPLLNAILEKKRYEENLVRDGMNVYKHWKDVERVNKIRDQREMRQMLENYWPWSFHNEQPRGFRNMYTDGIYPNEDFEKARRYSGQLRLGRSGGGAPIISHTGKRVIRTREDPMLRFQWSNDMRRTVDNTLRYKTSKQEQDEYRKQLDKLVKEKRMIKERERKDNLEFERKLGWSNEQTLKKLEEERRKCHNKGNVNNRKLKPIDMGEFAHKNDCNHDVEKHVHYKDDGLEKREYVCSPSNNLDKEHVYLDKENIDLNKENIYADKENINIPKENISMPMENINKNRENIHMDKEDKKYKHKRLSPLPQSGKDGRANCVTDLVPLIAERRANLKIPLGTTDVTRGIPDYTFAKYRKQDNAYLRELANQMQNRSQKMKEAKMQDNEQFRRHFNTWENFWGRPGHGAPRSVVKKGCLDDLLYPKMIPIYVH